ncbi:MAG: sulfite exporter TauE/SafE family protein [Deltaproteobacteria bacterium]|jgi:uncharacterized membrane protein YfcA|nr:sulfite exporter TauE/SafE family protein [Deltaproteobacteria bacterium]
MLASFALYLAPGCLAGLLAGLLGIGGGVVMVPILLYCLPLQGINEHVNLLALGTSMASIIFTSLASVRVHNGRKSVLWPVVLRLSPGLAAGTLLGGSVVVLLPGRLLSAIFAVFLFSVACQLLLDVSPRASRRLPGTAGLAGVGAGIGFFSSFVGIGGGTLIIPFLVWCNTPMREAVGTSAGASFPIALAGSLAYLVQGWAVPDTPPYCLGFIYLPAFLGLVGASMLTAPLGAKLAYKVPARGLKRFFALFLVCIAANILYKII